MAWVATNADGYDRRRQRYDRDEPQSQRIRRGHPIAEGIDGDYAYFVHSYYAAPDDDDAVVATTEYGRAFPAIVANEAGNVFGTQFHPEKSSDTGLRILRNFVQYCLD